MDKKLLWTLVFWPETCEISVISVADIAQIVKIENIRTGWEGDLPWIDEKNQTTKYEAKLLKISKYKETLESVNVSNQGQIIKKIIPGYVMEEIKKSKTHKKKRKMVQNDSDKKINDAILGLPVISTSTKTRDKIINKETGSRTDHVEGPKIQQDKTSSKSCVNCANCICKSWRSQVRPENVGLFQEILHSLKMATMKASPMANLKEKIELYPGTNVRATKENLLLAVTRAKGNPRAMIRNLLLTTMTKEEMLKYKTGETLYTNRTTEFLAISEYLKMNENVRISDSLFINVINKQLWEWRKKANLTEEQLEELRKDKCEKSKKYRLKKKSQNSKQPSQNLKRKNKASLRESLPEIQVQDQILSVPSPTSTYSTSSSLSPLPSPSPSIPENSLITPSLTTDHTHIAHTATSSSSTTTSSSSSAASSSSTTTSSSSTTTSSLSPAISSDQNYSASGYYMSSIPYNNSSYDNNSYSYMHQTPTFQQSYPLYSSHHPYSNHYYPHPNIIIIMQIIIRIPNLI